MEYMELVSRYFPRLSGRDLIRRQTCLCNGLLIKQKSKIPHIKKEAIFISQLSMEPAFILTSVSQVCWALVWEGLVAQVFGSVTDLTAIRKASTAAESGSSQLMITACWGPPPKLHCVFTTFKKFLRVVLIYQLQALVFLVPWGRQGKGILFCYEKHFLAYT